MKDRDRGNIPYNDIVRTHIFYLPLSYLKSTFVVLPITTFLSVIFYFINNPFNILMNILKISGVAL